MRSLSPLSSEFMSCGRRHTACSSEVFGKRPTDTYGDCARYLEKTLEKWLLSEDVDSFKSAKELILMSVSTCATLFTVTSMPVGQLGVIRALVRGRRRKEGDKS